MLITQSIEIKNKNRETRLIEIGSFSTMRMIEINKEIQTKYPIDKSNDCVLVIQVKLHAVMSCAMRLDT